MQNAQLKLHEKFIQVNEFTKECISKMIRTQAQIESEQRQQQALRSEIADLQENLNRLTSFDVKFRDIVAKLRPIKSLLEDVVKSSPAFESIEDLMGRFESLSEDNLAQNLLKS